MDASLLPNAQMVYKTNFHNHVSSVLGTIANFATVLSLVNSCSLYILLICRAITDLSRWNNSAICSSMFQNGTN